MTSCSQYSAIVRLQYVLYYVYTSPNHALINDANEQRNALFFISDSVKQFKQY